jgi:hypothetical protein
MFEFEATTYEIIRYVYTKGDRPAKCVDQSAVLKIGISGSKSVFAGEPGTPDHEVRGGRPGLASPIQCRLVLPKSPVPLKRDVVFFILSAPSSKLGARQNKKASPMQSEGLLLPDLDSNQDKQNQNLSYYRYTIGQSQKEHTFLGKGGCKFTTLC